MKDFEWVRGIDGKRIEPSAIGGRKMQRQFGGPFPIQIRS
jgi:hypothetical protein